MPCRQHFELTERLRRLETLDVVSRARTGYRLTTVGAGLMPVLDSLRGWAETWLPDDPAMVERDPDVVLGWLVGRVRGDGRLPAEPVVLELWPYEPGRRYWLVLQAGADTYGCLTDPLLDGGRYLYVRCALATLLGLARGRQALRCHRSWP